MGINIHTMTKYTRWKSQGKERGRRKNNFEEEEVAKDEQAKAAKRPAKQETYRKAKSKIAKSPVESKEKVAVTKHEELISKEVISNDTEGMEETQKEPSTREKDQS